MIGYRKVGRHRLIGIHDDRAGIGGAAAGLRPTGKYGVGVGRNNSKSRDSPRHKTEE
jgi:hypothetical protein